MSRISNNSFAVNSNLEQKIDIASVSASGVPISGTVDVDVTANSVGLATSSLQTTGNTSLATIAGDTTSLDGKVNQGYDAQIVSGGSGLQQNLCYGRDNSGNLDALRTDASGHLEITVDDFVKGQATMSNSFPVVIASDQSSIATTPSLATGAATSALQTTGNTSLASIDSTLSGVATEISMSAAASSVSNIDGKISQGYDAQIASGGSGAQQVLLYARDASGNLDALEVNGSGELKVSSSGGGGGGTHSGSQGNLFNASSVVSGDTSSVITTTSSQNVSIFGNTTDTSNPIDIEISADNLTFYPLNFGIFPDASGNFVEKFSEVSNYWRIKVGGSATITATLLHNT